MDVAFTLALETEQPVDPPASYTAYSDLSEEERERYESTVDTDLLNNVPHDLRVVHVALNATGYGANSLALQFFRRRKDRYTDGHLSQLRPSIERLWDEVIRNDRANTATVVAPGKSLDSLAQYQLDAVMGINDASLEIESAREAFMEAYAMHHQIDEFLLMGIEQMVQVLASEAPPSSGTAAVITTPNVPATPSTLFADLINQNPFAELVATPGAAAAAAATPTPGSTMSPVRRAPRMAQNDAELLSAANALLAFPSELAYPPSDYTEWFQTPQLLPPDETRSALDRLLSENADTQGHGDGDDGNDDGHDDGIPVIVEYEAMHRGNPVQRSTRIVVPTANPWLARSVALRKFVANRKSHKNPTGIFPFTRVLRVFVADGSTADFEARPAGKNAFLVYTAAYTEAGTAFLLPVRVCALRGELTRAVVTTQLQAVTRAIYRMIRLRFPEAIFKYRTVMLLDHFPIGMTANKWPILEAYAYTQPSDGGFKHIVTDDGRHHQKKDRRLTTSLTKQDSFIYTSRVR
jgi:hypothetical protein